MDSHVLNMYHQARYRTIGHKVMRSTSESVSSESSCNQNSPEYNQMQQTEYTQEYENTHATQLNQDSYDEEEEEENEEIIETSEVHFNHNGSEYHLQAPEGDNISLVEGDDYDVIQVYAVDPNLDFDGSSDEEENVCQVEEESEEEDTNSYDYQEEKSPDTSHDDLNISVNAPVISNVDEYFINTKDDILEIKDDPVVKDVDEYFIKKSDSENTPNVDQYFIKHELPEAGSATAFNIEKPIPNVDEFFALQSKKDGENDTEPDSQAGVSINLSDLEVLPKIEEIKRFLLADLPCSRLKNAQKSCSVPHSPHNICLDIDDTKTCLSDLNLDLSDLAFENEKEKTDNSGNKIDDIPRTLTDEDVNSFLITNKFEHNTPVAAGDDFSHQDMDIERPIESSMPVFHEISDENRSSTPLPQKPAVLDFCIEKPVVKKQEIKSEVDDFVDVVSCNDAVIPVLEANNLNSLLEQFEATEKLNTKKVSTLKQEEQRGKTMNKHSLTNGMRLQDAGVQLNKTKMRQILMPTTINSKDGRSQSPVQSDHDYCSPKKRQSVPKVKGGQSLLKPEVLSRNSKIINSRHRSCKNKKIVYNFSDDESEKTKNNKTKKNSKSDISDAKKKLSVKHPVKPVTLTYHKKQSPTQSEDNDGCTKSNNSVMNKSACKASDNFSSQSSNGSIKLLIINKSEVILNCDDKDSQKNNKYTDKVKSSSSSDKNANSVTNNSGKDMKELDLNKNVNNVVNVKEEPRPKDFYTGLFSNKQDVQVPQTVQLKGEKRLFDEELQRISEVSIKKEEQPAKKKKLNLQEYKMRKINSNNSSATVSPEPIFPDMPPSLVLDKQKSVINQSATILNRDVQPKDVAPKEVFDPIREASRKILMNTKKLQAMRKRDEDIVMSKIPKVENLQLQPLLSDAEMMKIVGMNPAMELPAPIVPEKPQMPSDYEEIIMVSVGVNTEERVFKEIERQVQNAKRKSQTPPTDTKSLINFKIKKSEHVLKQNVFDVVKKDKRSPMDDRKHTDTKIDKERYKGITAALKSVEKHVDNKMPSNSLFASIQDVVMKKAPEKNESAHSKSYSPTEQKITKLAHSITKTKIVCDYDTKADHGEDKVILHLEKKRSKPTAKSIVIQTDASPEFANLSSIPPHMAVSKEKINGRKRNDSDMSMSSEGSLPHSTNRHSNNLKHVSPKYRHEAKDTKIVTKKPEAMPVSSQSKEKRSRSKDRYDSKYRRRSRSRSRRRRSRSRSPSRGHYRRYRRSDSPYRRKRRSRSPYRRVSPARRDHRRSSRTPPKREESKSSRSPVSKKPKLSPNYVTNGVEKRPAQVKKSLTPPIRKSTVSESSESSSSSSTSSSSSSSSSSDDSRKSSGFSSGSYKREDMFPKKSFRGYSSEDRESNTPVEERRIVFVGKLEKDINKMTLRGLFSKFGPVMEVRLHTKEDGTRYGFVTYQRARDAWSAVEAASTFPHYDVGFGGRRAFCRQTYADLDGLEAKYTESAFHGQAAGPTRRSNDQSFEEMLLEMKKTLNQRKNEKKRHDELKP
ncbi:LOW QUALITY PROTEIN: PGC-1 family member spargel [Aphomia sociella]